MCAHLTKNDVGVDENYHVCEFKFPVLQIEGEVYSINTVIGGVQPLSCTWLSRFFVFGRMRKDFFYFFLESTVKHQHAVNIQENKKVQYIIVGSIPNLLEDGDGKWSRPFQG